MTSENSNAMTDEETEAFAAEFNELCRKHHAAACFVLVKDYDEERGPLIATGGVTDVCDFVDHTLKGNLTSLPKGELN